VGIAGAVSGNWVRWACVARIVGLMRGRWNGSSSTVLVVTVIWGGVRERLERLRDGYARGQAGGVFGADGHQFEILPPLRGADLAEAEAQFGVELPQDYRGFLTAVSAGGAGPYYGLFPLGRDAAGCWGWRGDGAELTDVTALGTNFDPGDLSATLAELEATRPPVDDDAYLDWLHRYENVLWDDKRTHGAVCLSHEGCAYRDWLVTTGPYRGQMWTTTAPAMSTSHPAALRTAAR
jgi:hypothetical protein